MSKYTKKEIGTLKHLMKKQAKRKQLLNVPNPAILGVLSNLAHCIYAF